MSELKSVNFTILREMILEHFDQEELRTLAFDLGFDYDDLRGEGRKAKAREMVRYLRRRQQIEELIAYCREHRLNGNWDTIYEARKNLPPVFGFQLTAWILAVGGFTIVLVIALVVILRPFANDEDSINPTVEPSVLPLDGITTPIGLEPLSVALEIEDDQACSEDERTMIENNISSLQNIRLRQFSEETDVLIRLRCSQELTVQFQQLPAHVIEFLDDLIVFTLPLGEEDGNGRFYIEAALEYANGNFDRVQPLLQGQDHAVAYLLQGNAAMHLEKWGAARTSYEFALQSWEASENDQIARTHAGIGLSYVLELDQQDFLGNYEAALDNCLDHALAHFDMAIAAQPERILWQLGKALTIIKCSESSLEDALTIVETSLQATNGLERYDEALLQNTHAALLYFFFQEPSTRVITLAEKAITLSAELPSSYILLNCAYTDQNNDALAAKNYQEYLLRLSLSWQIEEAEAGPDCHFPW